MRARCLSVLGALAACSFNPPGATGGDAKLNDGPGSEVLIGDDTPAATGHILLSEIAAVGPFEYVEIFNPTGGSIDLSTYYLSDSNQYWQLAGHAAGHAGDQITLISSDFLVRFPTGTTLAPGAVITIAMNGLDFAAEYSKSPTYTVGIGVAGAIPMVTVIPSSPPLAPGITNNGEMVVLFRWDGLSDLVEDVDLVVTGQAPDPPNTLIAKRAVDGIDLDTVASSYQPEAQTIGSLGVDATGKKTYKRLLREGDLEVHTGGNGITGDDESSEQIRSTWDSATSDGTPGFVPTGLQ